MPNSVLSLIVYVVVLGVVLFSIWKGDTAVRLAGCFVAAGVLYSFGVKLVPHEFRTLVMLTGDFLLAMGFLALAVRYASLWLGGAMLFQAVQFMLHAWYMLGEKKADVFHAVVNNLDTVGILVCLLIGTITAWRRRTAAQRSAMAAEAIRAEPAATA
ncbi:MAG: hypothetical protein JWR84_1695 [Caulobacter sp.]|nr:hypothetical protein [Caulobacter sp.]